MKVSPRYFAPVLWLGLALVLACGGPPKTRLDRLYDGLADPLPRVDPSILEGRRILVDPGHGGYFRGTVGKDSLAETEVNLGVSLYLWGLLNEAGAEVYLTRAVDRDFLSLTDSSLAGDLQARVDRADSLEPDIFISIHHNAQPQRQPEYNRVETYYKAGDPASLDLAFAIHRHLMRNLGIEAGEVRQGNYYVLRNVEIPAVLGESSYLTHPPVEEKLKLSNIQRLEAEAYFLGILDYFDRGIPRVTPLSPADSIVTSAPAIVFALGDDGGIGIDPDGVDLRINGARVDVRVSGDDVRYEMPWDSPNGNYAATLSVRNLLGNTAPTRRIEFLLDHPAQNAVFNHWPKNLPAPGSAMRVRVRLLDARGLPVAEGTEVIVTTSADTTRRSLGIRGGVADFAVRVAGDRLTVGIECAGQHFEATIKREGSGSETELARIVRLVDANDGTDVTRARLGDGSGATGAGDYLVRALPAVFSAPGYVPLRLDSIVTDTLALTPWFGGVLKNRRFVLDPEAGKPEQAGAGTLGLSASHVNLRVAHYLAGFLRQAGADVLLTRTTEEVRTAEDIARMTNRYPADRYIELRHRTEPPESVLAVKTFHFPGSRNGRAMCDDLGSLIAGRLGVPAREAASQVTYPLQQTACPAIIIEYPAISHVDEELRLDRSQYLRDQAYATFAGIVAHFGSTDSAAVEVRVTGEDVADWLVTVDGTWTLLTDEAGSARFESLPYGEREVVIRKRGNVLRQSLIVDSDWSRLVLLPPSPTP